MRFEQIPRHSSLSTTLQRHHHHYTYDWNESYVMRLKRVVGIAQSKHVLFSEVLTLLYVVFDHTFMFQSPENITRIAHSYCKLEKINARIQTQL